MNKSELGALIMVALMLVSGCISTTSGPPKSDPDDDSAADLNYQLGARYLRNGNYELARDRLLQ